MRTLKSSATAAEIVAKVAAFISTPLSRRVEHDLLGPFQGDRDADQIRYWQGRFLTTPGGRIITAWRDKHLTAKLEKHRQTKDAKT